MNRETQAKIFLFLQRLWGWASILTALAVVVFLLMKDNDSALFFFGFFLLSAVLYLLRKRQLQRFLEDKNQHTNLSKKE